MSDLVIGTAQLGLTYGKTNITGKPSSELANQIIKFAIDNNIKTFDTAREYGDSEKILSFVNDYTNDSCIITKLCKFDYANISEREIINKVYESINTSCLLLNINKLPVLLLHSYEYYKKNIIWNTLIDIKNKGIIDKIGVSVYNIDEAIAVLKDTHVEHIQLPINILDFRWNNKDFLDLVIKRKNLTLHVRSIFLQGILLNNETYWPENCNVKFYIEMLEKFQKKFNFSSKKELCLSYVKSFEWINGIIIGVETIEQLKDNIELFNKVRKLREEEINIIKYEFKNTPIQLLDPRLW